MVRYRVGARASSVISAMLLMAVGIVVPIMLDLMNCSVWHYFSLLPSL